MRCSLLCIFLYLIPYFIPIWGGVYGNTSTNTIYANIDIYNVSKSKLLAKQDWKPDSIFSSKLAYFENESLPVIFFAVYNTDEAFQEVEKWGGTHVHKYGMGKSIKNDQQFFDRAQEHGLKVMSDLRARYWLKDDKDLERFGDYIEHFNKHPALGFWYLSDEPDNKGFAPLDLEPLYKSIQKTAPDIPIALSHAWTEDWYDYEKVQDILMYNNYPIYGGTFPENRLEAWTKFTKSVVEQAKKEDDLVIPVLQIFNWRVFVDNGQKEYHNYPIDKLRYPKSKELRYMIFTSIGLGARGISLFSYANSKKIKSKWGSQVLAPVIKEAKKFANEVKDIKARKNYLLKNDNSYLASWSNKKNEFTILVNSSSSTRRIQFMVNERINNLDGFQAWGKTRQTNNIILKGGELTVKKMKPWEVIILKRSEG